MSTKQRVSIWFFIGILLSIYGVLITATGLYGLHHPPSVKLAELHAGLWWGILLLAIGAGYSYAFFPGRRSD